MRQNKSSESQKIPKALSPGDRNAGLADALQTGFGYARLSALYFVALKIFVPLNFAAERTLQNGIASLMPKWPVERHDVVHQPFDS